jgi:hypothetical protein
VGSKLAAWVSTSLGPGLSLTESGKEAAQGIKSLEQVLQPEIVLISEFALLVTEQRAKSLTSAALTRA